MKISALKVCIIISIIGCNRYNNIDTINGYNSDSKIILKSENYLDTLEFRDDLLTCITRYARLKGGDYMQNGWINFNKGRSVDCTSSYFPFYSVNKFGNDSLRVSFFLNRSIFKNMIGIYDGSLDEDFKPLDSFNLVTKKYNDSISIIFENEDFLNESNKLVFVDIRDTINGEVEGVFFFLKIPYEFLGKKILSFPCL